MASLAAENKLSALVIGSTGATGRQITKALLESPKWNKVTTLSRREFQYVGQEGDVQEGLEQLTLQDWDAGLVGKVSKEAVKADAVFIAIGTTRGAAGGAEGFQKIEVDYTKYAVALAREAGIDFCSVVTAEGSNADVWVDPWELVHPLLYMRTLGRKENAVVGGGFSSVSVFRPGMLNRLTRDRSVEIFINDWLGLGLRVDILARAMVRDAEEELLGPAKKKEEGETENAKDADSDSQPSKRVYTGNAVIQAYAEGGGGAVADEL